MSGEATRLGPEDWQKVSDYYAGAGADPLKVTLGAILDLNDQVIQVQQDMADLTDREGFNIRLEALKAAREHLSSLPSEQPNQRGYNDHAMKPGERVAQELRVAHYLLGGAG